MADQAPSTPSIASADRFRNALEQRLRNYFERVSGGSGAGRQSEEKSLCVGLMGRWGSGKTHHLEALHKSFTSQGLKNKLPSEKNPLVVPVLFNAWRYEKEEHLISPLLMTIAYELKPWVGEYETAGHAAKRLSPKLANFFSYAADALALVSTVAKVYGVAVASWWTSLVKVVTWLPKWLGNFNKPKKQEQADLYFNFQTRLKELMQGEDGGFPVRFLILVDDLDRCLPDKAIDMLEAIKLFLDIEGCAFVLAVDHEVVHRGIDYRYRDYNPEAHATDAVAHALKPERFESYLAQHRPQTKMVTGREYLEKIIQLWVEVPPPKPVEVEKFLADLWPDHFDANKAVTSAAISPFEQDKAEEKRKQQMAAQAQVKNLITIILGARVFNPRKLRRIAEAYSFAYDRAKLNGWVLKTQEEKNTLLQLSLLQLFAPDLYELCRETPELFGEMHQLAQEPGVAQNPKTAIEHLKSTEEKLAHELQRLMQQRGGFWPLAAMLGTSAQTRPSQLPDYYRLERQAVESDLDASRERPPGVPSDWSAFVQRLNASEPEQWHTAVALEQEALAGTYLMDQLVSDLIQLAANWPASSLLQRLELLAPYLNIEQMQRIYRETQLLSQLADKLPNKKAKP